MLNHAVLAVTLTANMWPLFICLNFGTSPPFIPAVITKLYNNCMVKHCNLLSDFLSIMFKPFILSDSANFNVQFNITTVTRI